MNIMKVWKRVSGLFVPEMKPQTLPAPAAPDIRWNRILELLGSTEEERKPYVLPAPLPGVRPAEAPTGEALRLVMDSGYTEPMALDVGEMPASWGFGASGQQGPGLSFLGFPYLAELAQITEYRTPAESLSNEMTRRWLKFKNKGKRKLDDKISEIESRFEQLKVRDLFREAALKTEQFGRAHIYASIKNQDDDITRQLPLTKIGKGMLLGLSCIEPYWLTPYSWNSTHPERPDFYKPQSWYVLGRKTHASRLLTFRFREVPDLLKPAYDFSGISMTQLMMPYVNRWLRTSKNVNDLINIFSIVTLSTDLQALIQDPVEFMKRLQTFTQTRDNRGLMVTNKDTEELTTQNIPLGSLDKLQAQAQEHMATPGRMPLIEFFGITPSGLNASSEGEFQARNRYVKGMQELGFTCHVIRLLEIVQMDLYGSVDPDITIEWQPLYEPNGKELAEIRKADADRDAVFVQIGAISPDEVRDKIRTEPESGYNGLEGEAPEPQLYPEPGEETEPKDKDE